MSTANNTTPDTTAEGTQSDEPASGTPKPAAAAPRTPAPTPAAADTPEGQDEGPEGKAKAGAEAAKYRTQLRSVEAERDTLAGSVETLRRQIIASNMPRNSSGGPELLWATGYTAAEMFNTQGGLDADKLKDAVREAHAKLGLQLKQLSDPVPSSGTGNAGALDGAKWSDILKR